MKLSMDKKYILFISTEIFIDIVTAIEKKSKIKQCTLGLSNTYLD